MFYSAKLRKELPGWYQVKIEVLIVDGSHVNKSTSKLIFNQLLNVNLYLIVEKQLNDKERVAAALECREVIDLLKEMIDYPIY